MYPRIPRSCRPLILVLPLVLIVASIGLSGGFWTLARAGVASLESVGHLITRFHEFPLDPLDLMNPRCI